MIQISSVTKAFGAQTVFGGADLLVGARDRLALVGPNGSGKTTLFDMITGAQVPDAGRIDVARGVRLGYLAQHTDALRGRNVLDEVLQAGSPVADSGRRLGVLMDDIGTTTDEIERNRLLNEYAKLQAHFETLGGYSLEAQAHTICAGLGFREVDLQKRTEELSGGWLIRVALAKLLLAAPDVLLLDEPTNHLDLESVRWLEGFLKEFEGAVLLISHDRDLINGFATRVVEIERGRLQSYTGDYGDFVEQRELRARQADAAAAQQQRKIAKTQLFIDRFRYKNTKAKQVQSRIKMLDKMERVEQKVEVRRAPGIGIPAAPRTGRIVLELEGVSFAYGETKVYDDLGFTLERGQKVALVGPNGAGKSTLLKLLAGALTPAAGERRTGANVSLGYFAQHQIDALDMNARVIEEVDRLLPAGGKVRARDLLGRFMFSGDEVDKDVRVLSGGERTRLAMAKLLAEPRNVLCLDEPTNHLDVWARDALEDALIDFDGAIVLITHDRHLIRQIANTIAEVIDGRVRVFNRDYESYLELIEAEAAPAVAAAATPASAAKERRRVAASERAHASQLRNKIKAIERELDEVATEIAEMNARMADPAFYTTEPDIPSFMKRYDARRARTAELERAWDSLTTE